MAKGKAPAKTAAAPVQSAKDRAKAKKAARNAEQQKRAEKNLLSSAPTPWEKAKDARAKKRAHLAQRYHEKMAREAASVVVGE